MLKIPVLSLNIILEEFVQSYAGLKRDIPFFNPQPPPRVEGYISDSPHISRWQILRPLKQTQAAPLFGRIQNLIGNSIVNEPIEPRRHNLQC